MRRAIDLAEASDMALVELARSGTNDAFGELWRRHSGAIVAATRAFTGYDPDDIMQEAFVRVLQQIQAGNGPQTAFRAYMVMTARNIAVNMSRARSSDEITGAEDLLETSALPGMDMSEKVLSNSFTLSVFTSLPTRWQEVLWYRDVEELPVQEVSKFLGMTPNATTVLIKRAREGFKQAWIAANLEPGSNVAPDCQWMIERLPQIVRGRATPKVKRKLYEHLSTCTRCAIVTEESEHLHSRLALVLIPAFVGAGTASYKAWIQSGGNRATQLAAAKGSPQDTLRDASSLKAGTVPLAIVSAGALATSLLFGGMSADTQRRPSPPSEASEDEQASALLPTGSSEERHSEGDDTSGSQPAEQGPVEQTDSQSEPDTSDVSEPPKTQDTDQDPDKNSETEDNTETDNDSDTDDEPETTVIVGVPSTLKASPEDGIEVGVYPKLAGTGAPDARVVLTVSNEMGEHRQSTVTADKSGHWRYTPSGLRGVLTVTGRQEYTSSGIQYLEKTARLGTFHVGDGLRMTIVPATAESSTIRVTGLSTPTKNQVVNVKSSAIGMLVSKQAATGPGVVEVTVPYATTELDETFFWQGDTSVGPWRVWRMLSPTEPEVGE